MTVLTKKTYLIQGPVISLKHDTYFCNTLSRNLFHACPICNAAILFKSYEIQWSNTYHDREQVVDAEAAKTKECVVGRREHTGGETV